jgi:hypothetical protein
MNPERWIDLTNESFILSRILDLMPTNIASLRELRIQNAKLLRMLLDPREKDRYTAAHRLLAGGSLKKFKKREGKHAQRIGQQAKKVRVMSDRFFKEFLRRDNKELSNAEYRTWRAKFDAAIAQQTAKYKKRLSDEVTRRLGQPISLLP